MRGCRRSYKFGAKRTSGFSIVELMVVVGLGSVVALGFASFATHMFGVMRGLRISQDAQTASAGIALALQKQTCVGALQPTPALAAGWTSTNTVTKIQLGTAVLADTTAPIGDLVTSSITLTKVAGPFDVKVNTGTFAAPALENMKRYIVQLKVIQAKGGQDNVGGAGMVEKNFFITAIAQPSAGDVLYSCYGGNDRDFFEELCERQMGGEYDESKDPSCRLDRLALTDATGGFTRRDAMLPTSQFSVTDDTTPHGSVVAPAGLTVRSVNNQAQIKIIGKGEDDAVASGIGTHSALYFFNEDNPTKYWAIAYKNESIVGNEQAGGLLFGRFDPGAQLSPILLKRTGEVILGAGPLPAPPGFVRLQVDGSSVFDGDVSVGGTIVAASTITPSDVTLKTSVRDLDSMLERIMDLRPVSYHWKNESQPEGVQYGLIAQEAQKSFPELVVQTPAGTLGVKYDQLGPILLKAMQELKKQNADLLRRIEKLEKK